MHQNDAFQQAEIPTLPPLELPFASDFFRGKKKSAAKLSNDGNLDPGPGH